MSDNVDMIDSVIPGLLLQVTNNDTAKRHGSILAISELILTLDSLGKSLTSQIICQIRYAPRAASYSTHIAEKYYLP